MTDNPEKPKIIIDEDWKTQVQAEKEAADKQRAKAPESQGPSGEQTGELPPPTLSFLLTTLATQTMVAMGDIANPITGKAEVRLDQAKHFIDTLAMLEEKTQGNRTPEESALLSSLLYQLRMAFVELKTHSSGAAM